MNVWEKYNIEINDWDKLVSIKFQENTNTGGIFCDVGACKGVITSLFKSLAGHSGMVYSFELNPYNYESIKFLKSDNCIIENLAVSDINGILEIYSDNTNSGNHTSNIIGYDTSYRKMNKIGTVKSIQLDEYFAGKKVDYLKVDVEGAELKVLKGAIETIKNCKYAIIECHFENQWQEINNFLKSNNLIFRNLVDDEEVFFGETQPVPGRGRNGNPYQMYIKNNR